MRVRSMIDGLRKLGLTEYEARAYITLVERGTLTANALSKYSEIPYSKIYDVLSRLEKKGWIIIEEEKPKKYKPKPPKEAIKISISKIESELRGVSLDIINELQPLYERIGIQEKPDVVILRGALIIIEKAKNMIDRATREIEMAVPERIGEVCSFFRRTIRNIALKGVEIKILTGSRNVKNLKKIADINLEIRLKEGMFGGGLIIDEKEALILLGGKTSGLLAIWSNHNELVKLAKIYFDHLWKDAKTQL